MADYPGQNVVVWSGEATDSLAWTFLARGVTLRVMDTRVTPPGLDKLPQEVERHVGGLNDEKWLLAAKFNRRQPLASYGASLSQRCRQRWSGKLSAISNCFAAAKAPVWYPAARTAKAP